MSKTDATDPYEVQARWRGLPGRIVHRHVVIVKHWKIVPVTWAQLVAFAHHEGIQEPAVFAALFGRFRSRAEKMALKGTVALGAARWYVGQCLLVSANQDCADELHGTTIIGFRKEVEYTTLTLPCDYHPDNGLANRQLRQSLSRRELAGSPLLRRYTREVQHYGGCRRKKRHYRSRSKDRHGKEAWRSHW